MGMLDVAMTLINRPDRQIKLHGQNHVEKIQDIPIKLINQSYIFYSRGIPVINSKNIYDTSEKSAIIVNIELF